MEGINDPPSSPAEVFRSNIAPQAGTEAVSQVIDRVPQNRSLEVSHAEISIVSAVLHRTLTSRFVVILAGSSQACDPNFRVKDAVRKLYRDELWCC